MRNPTSTETDVHYAISVLLAAGAVVTSGHVSSTELVRQPTDPARPWLPAWAIETHEAPAWTITTKDGRTIERVTEAAMVELAHDEATRRRDDWQRTIDHVEQLAMFAHEDTPRYEVR